MRLGEMLGEAGSVLGTVDPQSGDASKVVLDWISVGLVVASATAIITPIAQILSVIWLLLRIWESPTVKRWTRR